MTCPKCGSEVNKPFCTKCGTRLPAAEPVKAAAPEMPEAEDRPEPAAKLVTEVVTESTKAEKTPKPPKAEPESPEGKETPDEND